MQYKNAKEVLPPSLLKEMQEYIQGDLIYIPKANEKRMGWGEASGSKALITKRNKEILQLYTNGKSFEELGQQFHLSIDSIRKIIYKMR
ncbi:CD3324 family protein [Ornithinibacillus californiensis]|uniref:CD3324 family protein n=1 Tax=Ornithinibacillus californiensis TaxID=161536 RepID=UPI00064DE0EA|nr:CD3324 family protein [Ornithinibacillus californiensis]